MTTEHNGPMKVEDEIDAALKMLGETQPPVALVSRMHSCLETAAMSQRARSGRVLLIPAAGVAIAALVLVALFSQMHRTQRHQTSAVETARLVAATPLVQATIMSPSATAATKSPQEGKRLVQHFAERRSRLNRENRRAANFLSYPLTRQEKLLVRFVQTAKPEDLRDLNPEYQAKVEARQDAEFAAYLKSGSDSSTKETAN
ncbi:MAG TPA: hypothetical protein VMV98_00415 [Acidobacteriaceae bacterium]|nr:hypothetical protein [Acidobacteriaceae bacterium]